MAPGQTLSLEKGQPRTLAYTAGIRHDLKLLEVADDAMLQELLAGGCARVQAFAPCQQPVQAGPGGSLAWS